MGSIDKYIFRTTLASFALVLVSLTGVIWITQALRGIDLMTSQGQTIITFLGITSLVIPALVLVIAPIALMIAISHTLNKLATDSEIIVMNAAGFSPYRLFRPFFFATCVVAILVIFIAAFLAPDGLRRIKQWDAEITADVLTNIGDAELRLGNPDEAVRVLKQAEELCDEAGDKLHLAEAKRGLAKAYLERGDLKAARDCIKRSVDLFGQVRSKPHLAVALRTLGEVTGAGAWGDGHEVKAVDYFMRSIAICKEIGNELEVAKSYRAFSGYVSGSAHYQSIPEIQREAQKLSEMADEIFQRHRIRVTGSSSLNTNPQ
jgi:tetratricopeptide (TPR) repeat protein